MAEKATKKHSQKSKIPVFEWIAGVIGLILVTSTIGFLIYSAVTENSSPPKLTVSTEAITPTEGGFLVTFSLYNKGESHAADVVVEGKITRGGEELETSSVTINYSPSHSKRRGGLLFTKNPQDFEFQIRALGYDMP